jgi:hypothetical protein
MNELTCDTCRHMATFYTIANCWLCAHSWPAAIRVEPNRPRCEHYQPKMVQSEVEVVHSPGEIVHK